MGSPPPPPPCSFYTTEATCPTPRCGWFNNTCEPQLPFGEIQANSNYVNISIFIFILLIFLLLLKFYL
jgi:hypothetical protein